MCHLCILGSTLYITRIPPYYANLSRVWLSQTQKQVRYRGALVWNELPLELKESMSYTNFTYTYFMLIFVCSVFFVLRIVCVCMYVSVPPMRKSGYVDHCEVELLIKSNPPYLY